MFGGARGFGWGAAVCALALSGAALPSRAPALTIDATYDSSVTSNPNAAQIESAFNTIIAQFDALYVNPVTVNVTLHLAAGSFLGENDTVQTSPIPYSSFATALNSTAAPSNAPAKPRSPICRQATTTVDSADTGNTIQLTTPNARALGLSASVPSDSTII